MTKIPAISSGTTAALPNLQVKAPLPDRLAPPGLSDAKETRHSADEIASGHQTKALASTGQSDGSAAMQEGQTVSLFSPRYDRGTLTGQHDRPSQVSHSLTTPSYLEEFSTDEVWTFSNIVGAAHVDRADAQRVVSHLNTPERVASFLGAKFTWDDTHSTPLETYSPEQMLSHPVGVCRDQHMFATHALRQAGFESNTVGYGASGVHHAVTTFKDADGWGVIEYGNVHRVGAATEAEALAAVAPAALKFWVYADADQIDDSPGVPSRVYETASGVALKGFMHRANSYGHGSMESYTRPTDPWPNGSRSNSETHGGWRGSVASDMEGSTLSVGKDAFQIDARVWHGQDPLLKNAFGVAARYRPAPNFGVTLGVEALPNAHSYSIGPRHKVEHDTQIYFLGLAGNWDLLNLSLTANPDFSFNSRIELESALALGITDGTFDSGTSAALSHADVTWRNRLNFQAARGVRLWASGSAYLPVGDMSNYWLTGGDFLQTPATFFGEVGSDVEYGRFNAGMSVYMPIQVRTNLYADEPRLQLHAGYKMGSKTQLFGGTSVGFKKSSRQAAFVGVRHEGLQFKAGAQRAPSGEIQPYAQVKLELGGLF